MRLITGAMRLLSKRCVAEQLTLVFFLELFGIWLPLLYHGVYGLYMAYQSPEQRDQYGYFRNWMFISADDRRDHLHLRRLARL